MTFRSWMRLLIPLMFAVGLGACRAYPTKPAGWLANRGPKIASILVFPETIGQGDSLIVSVAASDPDGDTLVYDWDTDARLRIKSAFGGGTSLNNTHSNSPVFYRTTVHPIVDTAWVSCGVRDRRGGGDCQIILIPLRD